jgi:nitroreductase
MVTVVPDGFRWPVAKADPIEGLLLGAFSRATLAPSSHNSQPWAVAYLKSAPMRRALSDRIGRDLFSSKEHWLLLALDTQLALDALPGHASEMRLSCGMFLQLALVALMECGFAAAVVGLEAPDASARAFRGLPPAWRPLAAIGVGRGSTPAPPWSSSLAQRRHTNRGVYSAAPVPQHTRAELEASAPLFGQLKEGSLARVHSVAEAEAVRALGAFVARNAAIDFAHDSAWRETYRFIRFSSRQVALAEDGFSIDQLFGPMLWPMRLLLWAALSPPAMRLLRHIGVPRWIAGQLGELVARTPLLLLVTARSAAPWAELVAGGLCMDLWMRATSAGLALHPVSVVLQHTDLRRRFEAMLGIDERVVFFARAGQAQSTAYQTPRRSLESSRSARPGWVRL